MSEWLLTCVVSGTSLTAVWFPFYRGLRLCYEARRATRHVPANELKRCVEQNPQGGANEPLALVMARTLMRSLQENHASHPREFIVDASRQYVINEYDMHYAQRITMYANLLPPIGLTGNTIGMFVILVAMHAAERGLELGALALALTSTIFALLGFSLLESLKLRLYSRLLACLDEVISMQHRALPPAAHPPTGLRSARASQ